MKILVIHNFHRTGSASGDDQVFKSETALLEEHGHDVIRYAVCNDEFDKMGVLGKAVSTFGMLWSYKHYWAVRRIIREERPDIVHVHSFFPLLSPSILYAAKRCSIPVVATLHDNRLICPCFTSLRENKICNECGDGKYFRMVKYGCFKGSRFQSFLVAGIFKYHRIRRSFYEQIDRYICLNDSQVGVLKSIGFDKARIVKKYNFVPDADACIVAYTNQGEKLGDTELDVLPERYVVFYGRIGEEKGIKVLMKIWEQIPDISLVVMGGGPLEEEFKAWAEGKGNIHYLGYTEHEKCLSIVKGGEFVVFPSIWYEGCSMVEIETESLGMGLIATDLGFSAEAIENGVNGFKIPLGDTDGFVKAIKKLWDDPERCRELGRNARKDYEMKYMPERSYRQLMEIYKGLK